MSITPKQRADREQIERIWKQIADQNNRTKAELTCGPNDWKLFEALLNAKPDVQLKSERK